MIDFYASLCLNRTHGTTIAHRNVGWSYYVTARGNERKAIYRNDSDRVHFLELLAESTERFHPRSAEYMRPQKSNFLSFLP